MKSSCSRERKSRSCFWKPSPAWKTIAGITSNWPCPLEELVKGAKAPDWNIGKLKFDPATDANYKYTITISGRSWEARAIPHHEGFGGVFYDGSTTIPHSYYNSNGPATSDNTRLGEIEIVGDTFKTR